MSNFIYDESSAKNDPLIGKFLHPIKAIIENESDYFEKNKQLVDVLTNREKSNRYAETVFGQTDFDTFTAKEEGQGADNDSIEVTRPKTIEHIEFGKNFTITKKMADDSLIGIGKDAKARVSADMKSRAKGFVRAYYKTKTKIVEQAYINATAASMTFNKAKVDLTSADGLPVFHNKHTYFAGSKAKGTQCNYFYNAQLTANAINFEKALNVLSNKMRNFKDENGEVMGYVADTLIIPGNRPILEDLAKKVCGSERTTGTGNNDINTQYGNWTIVVMPDWQATKDEFIVLSSEANENLLGTMFYDRKPLDIKVHTDWNTRNTTWNGYCRFGIGFTTWKHALRAINDSSATNADELTEIA